MGVTRLPVAIKLDAAIVERIDKLTEHFYPAFEGRSHMIRVLLQVALAAMDSGALPDTLEGFQQILRRESRAPRIVKAGSR